MTRTHRFAAAVILIAGAGILFAAVLLQQRPSATSAPATGPKAAVTREVAPRRWEVSCADRTVYFADPARVNRDLLLRPVAGAEPDSITALHIARLSPDSPVYSAGFREGDRIVRIDGAPVARLGEAVNLVHRIQSASRLTVDVERAGQELAYQFEFR